MNLDIEGIVRKLQSTNNKSDGLEDLSNALSAGCSTATFLGHLEKLFQGLRSCLLTDPQAEDLIMKANQVLLDMVSDIQHSDDLEI